MSKLEALPNEILILIFCNLSWFERTISLWSLNARFNFLICLTFSIDENGIIFNQPGLSYKKCYSGSFPLISNLSTLSIASFVRHMHFDGTNSNVCDLIHKLLFHNNFGEGFHYPNLKSLVVSECLLSEPLIKSLSWLIENQLYKLTLSFEKVGKQTVMLKKFINKLFSRQNQLVSLRLDIANGMCDIDIHQCLSLSSYPYSRVIFNKRESYCLSLRYLHIHLIYTCFLEHIIECIPALEQMSVNFKSSMNMEPRSTTDIETLIKSNGTWFDKLPKLESFSLKTLICDALQFAYLKWLLNNVNYIRKLKIRLGGNEVSNETTTIWNLLVDANFIRQYCMPDICKNLTNFDFYIAFKCELLSVNTEKIINSFKIHPFFIDRQWTNVTCFFDPILSYQHLSSSIVNQLQFYNGLRYYPNFSTWPYIRRISIDLHPSIYSLLQRFDQLFPNVWYIKVNMIYFRNGDESDRSAQLRVLFETERWNLINIQLSYVTRLDFGFCSKCLDGSCDKSIDRNKTRAKMLACLISMTVQLKYLIVENFQWLLHAVQYASNELKNNLLLTVQYAEFGVASCHRGSNESISVGKNLVPFLSTYVPHLQTLRLWRPDDFPWTSIRPGFKLDCRYAALLTQWLDSLITPQSIAQHVTIFQQDLCQLAEELKELCFLDIYGAIHREKVESYHSMVKTCFPNSQIYIGISRFRLWI
ncbi:unnamed protein product [Rotaria socialis]|uniref:F-box domain-containing protein n=1 Tax=Rotaria socialis TaxID=392032 RepID=A0A818BKB0_9BILA|nr:unnamed protein product [Rotaria socialis]CAF4452387.1 unnamed protein product [Rotaria socialis]